MMTLVDDEVLCVFRQEKLEQLALRFDRKAGMRETWLSENQRLVSQDNFGYDLAAVEASTKKHEAIEADISSYEERVQAVVSVAFELEQENYRDIERINSRWVHLFFSLESCGMRNTSPSLFHLGDNTYAIYPDLLPLYYEVDSPFTGSLLVSLLLSLSMSCHSFL